MKGQLTAGRENSRLPVLGKGERKSERERMKL